MLALGEKAYGHLRVFDRPAVPRSLLKSPAKLGISATLIVFLLLSLHSSIKKLRAVQTDTPPQLPLIRASLFPGRLVVQVEDYRLPEIHDGFENFTRDSQCHVNSLQLHTPFAPLCQTHTELLRAASEGGRARPDGPYSARDCDFRWFTSGELCDIMDRFSAILIIGDSQQRNLATALHTILRTDLITGAVTASDPDFANLEPNECACEKPFDGGKCVSHSAWSSAKVRKHDPESFYCQAKGTTPIEFHSNKKWPVEDSLGIREQVPAAKPNKPIAFVMGGGISNGLNETETHMWLDQIEGAIRMQGSWLDPDPSHPYDATTAKSKDPNLWRGRSDIVFPRLFITPSAAGGPEMDRDPEGNIPLERFERNMGPSLRERGYDHLGTYNMTVQNTSPDGLRAGMHANLLKAMIVFNWLDKLDLSKWKPGNDS